MDPNELTTLTNHPGKDVTAMELKQGCFYIYRRFNDPKLIHSCCYAEFFIDKPPQLDEYLRLMAAIKSDPVRYQLHQDNTVDFTDANSFTFTSHQVIWFERNGGEHGD